MLKGLILPWLVMAARQREGFYVILKSQRTETKRNAG
jgi:hypothetical protein